MRMNMNGYQGLFQVSQFNKSKLYMTYAKDAY